MGYHRAGFEVVGVALIGAVGSPQLAQVPRNLSPRGTVPGIWLRTTKSTGRALIGTTRPVPGRSSRRTNDERPTWRPRRQEA